MVFERPLLDRADLIDSLGPISSRSELTYRWLRRQDLVSVGIRLPLRAADRMAGSTILVSALNREGIAAARVDDLVLARELAHEATRLEGGLESWVRDAEVESRLGRDGDIDDDPIVWTPRDWRSRWSRQMLSWAQRDAPALLEGLSPHAAELAATRDRFSPRLPLAEVTMCRVWRIDGAHAELRPLSGQPAFSFVAREVLQVGLRLGDAVAVRHEELSPGTVITTLDPAIDIRRQSDGKLSRDRMPTHLRALLAEGVLPARSGTPAPLRRVA